MLRQHRPVLSRSHIQPRPFPCSPSFLHCCSLQRMKSAVENEDQCHPVLTNQPCSPCQQSDQVRSNMSLIVGEEAAIVFFGLVLETGVARCCRLLRRICSSTP